MWSSTKVESYVVFFMVECIQMQSAEPQAWKSVSKSNTRCGGQKSFIPPFRRGKNNREINRLLSRRIYSPNEKFSPTPTMKLNVTNQCRISECHKLKKKTGERELWIKVTGCKYASYYDSVVANLNYGSWELSKWEFKFLVVDCHPSSVILLYRHISTPKKKPASYPVFTN